VSKETRIINDVKQSWAAKDFDCALWVDQPGQVWENFVHDVDELVMVLEGDVEFEVDGRCHHPYVGESLLIPAKTIHTVRNIGGTTARWLYGYRAQGL